MTRASWDPDHGEGKRRHHHHGHNSSDQEGSRSEKGQEAGKPTSGWTERWRRGTGPADSTADSYVETAETEEDAVKVKSKRMLKMETNQYVREFLAETLGTFALVLFGDGAVAQVVLGKNARNDDFFGGFLNICLGYGLALMVGICISGGVSGGHLNPAVTIAMAAVRKLKPIQIPIYMAGQYLGAFLAALVLWGEYADLIKLAEATQSAQNSTSYSGLTMGIFASYPSFPVAQVTTVSLAMDQLLGTALLLIIILAVTDEDNMKISSSLVPLTIGLGLTAIHLSFGLNAGSAINPARDFSPRLLTFLAGWGQAFTAGQSWFWIPWLLPHLGGILGALVYQFMVAVHHP